MSNRRARKSCVVPKCTNTTTKTPEKLFFHVPMDVKMRKKWIKAMKRLDSFGAKSAVYCCEDHFDIESDMDNYVKYKLVGGRLLLKKGTVPHKFQCQKEKVEIPIRSAVQKRNKIKYFEVLLSKDEEPITLISKATKKPEEEFVACCEDEIVIEDPLSYENNEQCLKTSKKSKGVQVKLRDKGVPKSTMTDIKYFKKERKLISWPDIVSVRSMTDTSSDLSTHEIYDHDKDSLNSVDDLDSDAENLESEKHFLETICKKQFFYAYI